MNDQKSFELESLENIKRLGADKSLHDLSNVWINKTNPYKYAYNWRSLGLPIIQFPQDIVITQEIIWKTKPTIIIETGIARGGSLTLAASQLALLDLSEKKTINLDHIPTRFCIGIDIDIRKHNKNAIKSHPFIKYIKLIEGSSTSSTVFDKVKSLIKRDDKVMVILDSNHTYKHVIHEINMYSELVSIENYLVVHDTGIEFVPDDLIVNRSWGKGNNPLTAVKEFLTKNDKFVIDKEVNDKLLITSSPNGYLKRIK